MSRFALGTTFHNNVTVTRAVKEYDQSDARIILTLRQHQHAYIGKYIRASTATRFLIRLFRRDLRAFISFQVSPITTIILHEILCVFRDRMDLSHFQKYNNYSKKKKRKYIESYNFFLLFYQKISFNSCTAIFRKKLFSTEHVFSLKNLMLPHIQFYF